MQLKNYQNNALTRISDYFKNCQTMNAKTAFEQFSALPYKIASEQLADVPYICVRIPTGGGKTLLASYAITQVADQYLYTDYPLALWLVPSDTIKSQTAEALKNPKHPYRIALDNAFNREVLVIDIDEFSLIRPQDLGQKSIIIVSTIQKFRVENKDSRKIYRHNEQLEYHFNHLPNTILNGLDKIDDNDLSENGLQKTQLGKLKCSFANLLKVHRPLIMVDEAHNARTSLTFDVLEYLSPSAIVEFTATPSNDKKTGSNIIYSVSASTLKDEQMIKLPIVLNEYKTKEEAISGAIFNREKLALLAQNEKEYIRPIVLFQAENKNGEFNAEFLKSYLINELNIDEQTIAIATGNQKELDNIDLLDNTCPILYVITVEALKEGWDCPFAYVFCSLQNVGSSKEAEQLLGRVLRMPYAKRRQMAELNRAYAHLSSPHFGMTAKNLTDRLIAMGFEALEIADMLRQTEQESLFNNDDLPLFDNTPKTVLELPSITHFDELTDNEKSALTITQDNEKFLVQVTGHISDNVQKVLTKNLTATQKKQVENQLNIHKSTSGKVSVFCRTRKKVYANSAIMYEYSRRIRIG